MLFRRLGVFVGGGTEDAAAAICRDVDGRSVDVDRGLRVLHESSLVGTSDSTGAARVTMLETIREYALERLRSAGKVETVRRAHALHYCALVEQAEHGLAGPTEPAWFARCEVEHDNLRAALDWALDCRETGTALRLGAALWPFWYTYGYVAEGRRWLAAALRLPGDDGGTAALRAGALVGAGRLASTHADYAGAARCYDESLALARACRDTRATAAALAWKGKLLAREASQEAAAAQLVQESLTLARELDDRAGIVRLLQLLGRLDEGLVFARELADTVSIASLLCDLGDRARGRGDDTVAAGRYEESLALFRELHHQQGVASTLHNLGYIALHRGNPELAEERFQEGLTTFRDMGHTWSIGDCLIGLAGVAVAQNGFAEAACLLGKAEALQRPLGGHRSIANQTEFERIVHAAREHLGATDFAVALSAGQTTATEEATGARDPLPNESN